MFVSRLEQGESAGVSYTAYMGSYERLRDMG